MNDKEQLPARCAAMNPMSFENLTGHTDSMLLSIAAKLLASLALGYEGIFIETDLVRDEEFLESIAGMDAIQTASLLEQIAKLLKMRCEVYCGIEI